MSTGGFLDVRLNRSRGRPLRHSFGNVVVVIE
jgi:hypothetical protein